MTSRKQPKITQEIFEQFSKCERAGFLASEKFDISEMDFFNSRRIGMIEFRRHALSIILKEEGKNSKVTLKNKRVSTLENEEAHIDLLINNTLFILVPTTEKVNWIEIQVMAYMVYVLRKKGFEVDKVVAVKINKDYDNTKMLKKNFLLCEYHTKSCNGLQPRINTSVKRLINFLKTKSQPKNSIDHCCEKPYRCPFRSYCHKNQINQDSSTFDLNDISFSLKLRLFREGKLDLKELPSYVKLGKRGEIQYECDTLKKSHVDPTLKKYLSAASGAQGTWFLEVEYFKSLYPIGHGHSVNEVLPMGFALYFLDNSGEGYFSRYIAKSNESNELITLAEKLRQFLNLRKGNPIVLFNSKKVLQALNGAYSYNEKKSKWLKDIIYVDLMNVFLNNLYYDYRLRGNLYFKEIVKVILPEINYEQSAIKSGLQAESTFKKDLLEFGKISESSEKSLTAYLKKDVSCLANIYLFLKNL